MSETKTEYDMAQVALKMNAAKIIAVDKYPYLHAALFSMVPVCVPNLGTFASDIKWRMYYDPQWVMDLEPKQIAGLLMHEVGHCVRGHGERFAEMNHSRQYAKLHNIAGDSLINEDLREDGLELPDNGVYIATLTEQGYAVDRSMSIEQIYSIMKEKMEDESCTCGDSSDNDDQDKEQESDTDSGTESGDSGESDESGDSGESDESGESGESGESDESGDSGESGESGESSSKTSGRDTNCPVHGDPKPGGANGNGEGGEGEGNGLPIDGWDCGSAADGVRRDYEAEGDKIDPGVDEERSDVIRRQIAKEIKEHSAARGTVPGSWERWAKEILEPVIDWRKEFASIVRRAYASVAGIRDYTYRRPSRRQSAMDATGQGIILPAMRAPEPPKTTLVFDTSGSMSDEMLGWALSECKGILRGLGASGRTVRSISCDTQVSRAKRVTSLKDVDLGGGGGTDMRVGIRSAMEVRDKPDVIVVLTDGYTPWPSEPIKNVTLIAALTTEQGGEDVPSWARKVFITRDN